MSEEKRALISKIIKDAKEKGISLGAAAQLNGMSRGNFYSSRKSFKPTRKKTPKNKRPIVEVLDVPTVQASKLFVVYGASNELADFVRSMQ